MKLLLLLAFLPVSACAQIAIQGETIYTMNGEPIKNGIILIRDGKIQAAGPADSIQVPDGYRTLQARVVTPGLIDAHSVVGFSGLLNQPHDQEQLEKSAPIQPELRAIDGFNAQDPLVEWVRSFGVTTLHTGHAPEALVSGQTMIVKTHPSHLESALINPAAMTAVTLGPGSLGATKDKAPGTTSKAVAMLRSELIKAQEYAKKQSLADPEKRGARDLRLETFQRALEGKQPLLITVHRHQDITAALRLASEFKLSIVLDGLSDAPLVLDVLKSSGFPLILHPPMARASEERENLSFETPAQLKQAGILFALQSGFETYVPKTRVVLFEAALAAAHGLKPSDALAAITIDAARILRISDRTGSIQVGKDADIALFDGDPFEYTTHCIGTIVSGALAHSAAR